MIAELHHRPRLAALVAALGCAAAAGCGAHTELRDGVVATPHSSYRVGALGAGWERHDSDADLAFYDRSLDAMIMINSECPMEHDAPLAVAANTLLFGFTDRELVVDERVPMRGREALHRRVRAKLDGAPLELELFVLKKDDCLYDLVYLAPPATAARGAADFARLVDGFEPVAGETVARRDTR